MATFPEVVNRANGIVLLSLAEEIASWDKTCTKAGTIEKLLARLGGLDIDETLKSIRRSPSAVSKTGAEFLTIRLYGRHQILLTATIWEGKDPLLISGPSQPR